MVFESQIPRPLGAEGRAITPCFGQLVLSSPDPDLDSVWASPGPGPRIFILTDELGNRFVPVTVPECIPAEREHRPLNHSGLA